MIFVDNEITTDFITVRFYRYEDVNKGYGDIGTIAYHQVPIEEFELILGIRFDKSNYYKYRIKDIDKILSIKNAHMEIGYELGDIGDLDNEINELSEKLNNLKLIKKQFKII